MSHSSSCTCTGCAGLSAVTPVSVVNRPGLGAIAYRVGTQPDFRQSMLTALATSGPAGRLLTTRRSDDFSIGLLDAWATLADVLTFYQERIANESYLRTATERLSVQELARLIGYELQPGVAASTWLAFTLDAATSLQLVPDTLRSGQADLPPVTIPARTAVQSIPAPGEQPQTFETTEPVEARPDWNAMRPRPTREQELNLNMNELWLQGTAYNLKPGDVILISAVEDVKLSKLRKVLRVSLDETAKTTRLTLVSPPPPPAKKPLDAKPKGDIKKLQELPILSLDVLKSLQANIFREADFAAMIAANRLSMSQLTAIMSQVRAMPTLPITHEVFVFRKRVLLFGYNAPHEIKDGKLTVSDWPLTEDTRWIFLDTVYDELLPGGVIALQNADEKLDDVSAIIEVIDVTVQPRTAYGLSAKSTKLTVGDKYGR